MKKQGVVIALVILSLLLPLVMGCDSDSEKSQGEGAVAQALSLVSIAISPAEVRITTGETLCYSALGISSDGSTKDVTSEIVWASSSEETATISQQGVAKANREGEVIITASLEGKEASTTLTIAAPVTITSLSVLPQGREGKTGDTLSYRAIASSSDGSLDDVTEQVTWTSSDPTRASFESNGIVLATSEGTTTIQATLGDLTDQAMLTVTDPVVESEESPTLILKSLSVSPAVTELKESDTLQYGALATYTDGSTKDVSTEVTWNIVDPEIATISLMGLVQAGSPGTTSVTATLGEASESVPLTVIGLGLPLEENLEEDQSDSAQMEFMKEMISTMITDPMSMVNMMSGMLTAETIQGMIRWLGEPGVIAELLSFAWEMMGSMIGLGG